MKHTALYLRVSTEAQADEGYSLAAQAEKLEAYCRMKGIDRFTQYVDGGFSGSNLSRPAVTQLIDCIRRGEVERVVVYKLDRLSRSQKDTLYLIEDVFAPHGVDFVSINENIDTGTPYGRAMIGILSAFAQLERENIFLRTRMGMVERVRQGYWPGGGKIPFGYDYDAAKGILVPNRDADTVREIYARYLAGESAGSIARALGLRYEHLVRQILDRESNTGIILYKGERYPGRHEPLIDRETWLRAQRRLERHGVALFEICRGLAHGRGGVIDGDGGVERCVVECHNGGHDLGDRGDFHLLVGRALVIDRAVFAHDDGVTCRDVGTVRRDVLPLGFGGAADDIGVGLVCQRYCRHGGDAQGAKECRYKGGETKVQGVMAGAHNRSLSFSVGG